MKKLNFLTMVALGIVLIGCNQSKKSSSNNDFANEETQVNENISSQTEKEMKNISDKYLITNNSIGFFSMNNSWQKIAENDYGYVFAEGYGTCVDACCDGGFYLGKNLIIDEYNFAENMDLTIGALFFEECSFSDLKAEKNKYKNNKDVFLTMSDNCSGWYWKDKIGYIKVHSEKFKTKEGIGVGATLKEAVEKLDELYVDADWVEGERSALIFSTNSYPNISFIVENYEEALNFDLNLLKGKQILKVSDVNENTKIEQILISDEFRL